MNLEHEHSYYCDLFLLDLDKNETPNKTKVDINYLSEETRQMFLDRTYWDRKLWERYCKNVDITQT